MPQSTNVDHRASNWTILRMPQISYIFFTYSNAMTSVHTSSSAPCTKLDDHSLSTESHHLARAGLSSCTRRTRTGSLDHWNFRQQHDRLRRQSMVVGLSVGRIRHAVRAVCRLHAGGWTWLLGSWGFLKTDRMVLLRPTRIVGGRVAG